MTHLVAKLQWQMVSGVLGKRAARKGCDSEVWAVRIFSDILYQGSPPNKRNPELADKRAGGIGLL